MKARDVIAEVFGDADAAADASVAQSTLLAQTPAGEGVYIAPDGTLMRVQPDDGWEIFTAADDMPGMRVRDDLYRLVPIEEEPAEVRFPHGYPEDPVLGPYEDQPTEEEP